MEEKKPLNGSSSSSSPYAVIEVSRQVRGTSAELNWP